MTETLGLLDIGGGGESIGLLDGGEGRGGRGHGTGGLKGHGMG